MHPTPVCILLSGTILVSATSIDLSSGLVAYLPLDGNASDTSGNGNHGSVVGLSPASDRFGNANSAYSFDKNGYIEIQNSFLLHGANSAAISGWYKDRLNLGEAGFVIGAGDGRAGLDPFVLLLSENTIGQSLFTETTKGPSHPDRYIGFEAPSDAIGIEQDEWSHFVMQFSSSTTETTYQLFLDGSLAREISYARPHQITFDQGMPVQIGALTSFQDSQFRGEIDEVRFYSRILNEGEIHALAGIVVPDGGGSLSVFGGATGLLLCMRRFFKSSSP